MYKCCIHTLFHSFSIRICICVCFVWFVRHTVFCCNAQNTRRTMTKETLLLLNTQHHFSFCQNIKCIVYASLTHVIESEMKKNYHTKCITRHNLKRCNVNLFSVHFSRYINAIYDMLHEFSSKCQIKAEQVK